MQNIFESLTKWLNGGKEAREIPSSENLFWLMKQIKNKKIIGEKADKFGNSARATSGERRFSDSKDINSTYGSNLEVHLPLRTPEGISIFSSEFNWLESNSRQIDLSISCGPMTSKIRTIYSCVIIKSGLNPNQSSQNNLFFKRVNSNFYDNRYEYIEHANKLTDSIANNIITRTYQVAINLYLNHGAMTHLDIFDTSYKVLKQQSPIHKN